MPDNQMTPAEVATEIGRRLSGVQAVQVDPDTAGQIFEEFAQTLRALKAAVEYLQDEYKHTGKGCVCRHQVAAKGLETICREMSNER